MNRDRTPDTHLFPTRPYDLVKEFVIAVVVVGLLTVLLAAVFSSPDRKAITLANWANAAPEDVVATATAELAGTSTSASYGAPYNRASDGQKLGPLPVQRWGSVRIPIDSANDLVITPLSTVTGSPDLTAALQTWRAATADQQTTWAGAYADALAAAPDGDPTKVASGDYGPVPVIATGFLTLARSGGLEGLLTSHSPQHLLRLRRDEAAAATRRRRLPRGPGPRRPSRRRPVGHDERDGQLPRPAVDVALHVLVPGQAVLDLRQRRRPRLGADGRPHPRPDPAAVHPRPPLTAATPRRPPPHLAQPALAVRGG